MATRKAPTLITANGKTIYLNNKELLAEVIKSKKKGVMSNQLAMMLQMLCSRYAKKGNFVGYCVDDQTEALTQRGWVNGNEITTDDIILSYNKDTKQLTWSNVIDIYRNPSFSGPMHKITHRDLDALVTPNHKFVTLERGIVPVEQLICKEHLVLLGAPVESPVKETYTDDQVRTVGWAITEGHYVKGSVAARSIVIYQNEGVNSDKIRNALTEANIRLSISTKSGTIQNAFNCSGEFITDIYDTIAPKRVLSTEFILKLTQRQRLLLIDTMVNGDGWIRPNGGMSYCQKDKKHADRFVMLCTLAGLNTSMKFHASSTPPSKVHPAGGISECYTINIHKEPKFAAKVESMNFHGGRPGPGGRRYNKPNIPTEQYDGLVWCPTTEYGTFVCRRNGKVYVTGNSYNEDMQAYAMMMLVRTWNAFNPEKSNNPFAFFTQCIKHSFIQYLNQEKRQRNIRDLLLVDQGMSPSFGFDDGVTRPETSDDEEDFDNIKTEANRLAAISAVESVNETDLTDPEVETEEKTT